MILRRSLWLSPQVSALAPLERTLILELTALYTGPKPVADVFLSVRDAAKRCGVSDLHAVMRAFGTLERLGFITEVVAGVFATRAGGKSKARGWRLNWKALDGSQRGPDALPALDHQALTPRERKRVETRQMAIKAHAKSNFSVVDSTTLAAIRADMTADSVGDSTTRTPENPSFASPATVGDSTTHIYYQGGRGPVGVRKAILGPEIASGPICAPPEIGARFCDLVKLRRSPLKAVAA